MSPLTHVGMFDGIGGFHLAMAEAGVPTIAGAEIDKKARGVLHDRFPETHTYHDVKEMTGGSLRSLGAIPGRTVLSAGWPCQGNSVAGRRSGFADPRSGLWGEVVRILREFRPAWFVGENVPGLLSVNGGADFATVIGDLAELGYGFAWRILDAQHFGVPQRRRRVVIVGRLGDSGRAPAQVLLEPEGLPGDSAQSIRPRQIFARNPGRGVAHSRISRTVTASNGMRFDANEQEFVVGVLGEHSHTLIVRRLTPTETCRLQGYPDGHTATSDGKPQADGPQYKQHGNGIAVPMFAWVCKRIVAVDQEGTPR